MRRMGGWLSLRGMVAVVVVAWALMAGGAAAATTLPVDAYGRLPAIAGATFSPDGHSVGFLAPVKGKRCVMTINLDTGRHLAICPSTLDVDWFKWKSDKRVIMGMSKAARWRHTNFAIEGADMMAMDLDGDNLVELASIWQSVQLVSMLEHDPGRILVAANDYRSGPVPTTIDVNSGDSKTFDSGLFEASQWFADRDGHILLAGKLRLHKMVWYYRPNEQTDYQEISGSAFRDAGFEPKALGDRPGLIYVASTFETGRQAIYQFDPLRGQVISRYAARPDVDIDSLIVQHGRVIGYEYCDDQIEETFTDPAVDHDRQIIQAALPGVRVNLLDRTDDGRHVLAFVGAPGLPGTIYLLSRAPGKPTHLDPISDVDPNVPDEDVIPAQPVTYHARDGLEIHAYLTVPARHGAGPIPFVVLPHGGPYGRDTRDYDFLPQMIASRGYGVLQPNFRGSTGYGTLFESTGFGEWGRKMQDDVTDATQWLVDQKLADPKRICIVGWSYGGYAALMGAVRSPDLYRCVASIAGVSDLKALKDSNRIVDDAVPVFNGDRSLIGENSPDKHAGQIKAPVLLIHGAADTTVPLDQSVRMELALKEAGKIVETGFYENDDHSFMIEADRIAMLKQLDGFLERNLGPGVPH